MTTEESNAMVEKNADDLAKRLDEIEVSKLLTMEQLLAESEAEKQAQALAMSLLSEAEKKAEDNKLERLKNTARMVAKAESMIITKVETSNVEKPTAKQVGGSHYKDQAIQPVEFVYHNKLNFLEGSAIKYICRHRRKNGKEDLEKAIHYLQMLVELEYTENIDQNDHT
jgi:uncharacterized membrane protein YheB (UPF0754 family)